MLNGGGTIADQRKVMNDVLYMPLRWLKTLQYHDPSCRFGFLHSPTRKSE